jgi:hypothetical protein
LWSRFLAGGRALLLLPLLQHCSPTPDDRQLPPPTVTQVLERHTDRLMSLPGVVGTAEGECSGRPCILVLVERVTPSLRQAIPSELEGIRVEIRETGRVQAQ